MGPGGIGIGTVGMAAGSAFIPLAITGAALWGGHALYESAKDLDTERNRFKLYGLSAGQNAQAFGFVDSAQSYGVSRAERMKLFREAQGSFRESGRDDAGALEGAMMAMPLMAKLAFATSALDGESKQRAMGGMLSAIRYAEMSGGTKDPAKFASILDLGWKLTQTSGGQVNWESLRQFKARAGSAGTHLTDQALAELEPIMGELTGSAAGVALRTGYGRLAGLVKVPNQVAHQLVDHGLWDNNSIEWNAQGGVKTMKGNPLGADKLALYSSDPAQFYFKFIQPIYEKMKYSGEEITRQNALIFGREGGKMFDLIEKQSGTILKSIEAVKKAAGINEAVDIARKGLAGKEEEFGAAWTDFKAQFGTVALPFFTGVLKTGAEILRWAGKTTPDENYPLAPGEHASFVGKTAAQMKGGNPLREWLRRSFSGSAEAFGTQQPVASPYIAGRTTAGQPGPVVLNMDGRKVGEIVSFHQGQQMSRPQIGPSGFDSRMSLAPAGGY